MARRTHYRSDQRLRNLRNATYRGVGLRRVPSRAIRILMSAVLASSDDIELFEFILDACRILVRGCCLPLEDHMAELNDFRRWCELRPGCRQIIRIGLSMSIEDGY